jgi:hypothetical protein
MAGPGYPVRYQINTRVWLTELSQTMGRSATPADLRGPIRMPVNVVIIRALLQYDSYDDNDLRAPGGHTPAAL